MRHNEVITIQEKHQHENEDFNLTELELHEAECPIFLTDSIYIVYWLVFTPRGNKGDVLLPGVPEFTTCNNKMGQLSRDLHTLLDIPTVP